MGAGGALNEPNDFLLNRAGQVQKLPEGPQQKGFGLGDLGRHQAFRPFGVEEIGAIDTKRRAEAIEPGCGDSGLAVMPISA
jgi:hypothetical protein